LFNKLKTILEKSKFVKQVSILAGGTALGQLVSIAVSPLLTRLYTPESFGILAVYASTLAIMSISASLRYELAIPITNKDEDIAGIITLSSSILMIVTLFISVILWFWGNQLTSWFNLSQINSYLWLLPIGILATGLYQIFNYLAIRLQLFTTIAQTKLYQGISQAIVQISWGLIFGNAPIGLMFGQIASQSTGTLTLARKSLSSFKDLHGKFDYKFLFIIANRYRRFPMFSASSALINNAGLQLPSLLLIGFYEPHVVGLYALGERLTRLPLTLIGQSIAQVYLGEASRRANENIDSLKHLFHETSKKLLLSCIPLALLFLLTTPLYAIVFGRSWSEAGVYVLALTPMLLARFVVTPLSQTLNVLERQDLQLAWDITRLACTVLSLLIPYFLGWEPLQAILTYSIVMLFTNYVLYRLSVFALNHKLAL
jgi:O-antigen/teichoic acid export membrane protein